MANAASMKTVWTEARLDQLAEKSGIPGDKLNLAMTADPAKDHLSVSGRYRGEEKSLKAKVRKGLEDPCFAGLPMPEVKGGHTNTSAHHYTRDHKSPEVQFWMQRRQELASEAGIDAKHIRVAVIDIDGNNHASVCIGGDTAAEEQANLSAVTRVANIVSAEEGLSRPQFTACSKVECTVAALT